MPRRTSLRDSNCVQCADDLDEVVQDKREGWRAIVAKTRRRQRRYTKRMADEIARLARDDTDFPEV